MTIKTLARICSGLLLIASTASYAMLAPLTQDTHGRSGNPNGVFGSNISLFVYESLPRHALIQFDTSGFAGTVTQATLSLELTALVNTGDFEVRRLLSPWNSANLTFSTIPPFGAAIDGTKTLIPTDVGNVVSLDISSAVQGWLDDPSTNHGIILLGSNGLKAKFASAESTQGGPTLDVVAAVMPGPNDILIESVFVNGTIEINGQNFDNGDPPTAMLSGVGLLVINSSSATQIIAQTPPSLPDGDYLLTVSTGTGVGQTGTFDVTIGAVGNQGPQGKIGPQGVQGKVGPDGSQGVQGKLGAPGPQGMQGKIGPAGADGTNGTNGAQGVQGKIGPAGPPGSGGSAPSLPPPPSGMPTTLSFTQGATDTYNAITVTNSVHFVRQTQDVAGEYRVCRIDFSAGTTPQDGMTVTLIMDQDPQTGSSGGPGVRAWEWYEPECVGGVSNSNIFSPWPLLNGENENGFCTYSSNAIRNGAGLRAGWICQ